MSNYDFSFDASKRPSHRRCIDGRSVVDSLPEHKQRADCGRACRGSQRRTAEAAPVEEATPAEAPAAETAAPADAAPAAEASAAGPITFRFVAGGAEARFQIDEVLMGQNKTVVGATPLVEGELTVDASNPAAVQVGTIRVDASDFTTDDDRRTNRVRNDILRVVTGSLPLHHLHTDRYHRVAGDGSGGRQLHLPGHWRSDNPRHDAAGHL
jgi:hypothetical protein